MKCNQSRSRFELVSPCPFPTTITITPRAPPQSSWLIISQFEALQLDQLSLTIDEKHTELYIERGLHIPSELHQNTCSSGLQTDILKFQPASLHSFSAFNRHCNTFTIPFIPVFGDKILLMKTKFNYLEDGKSHQEQFFVVDDKKF